MSSRGKVLISELENYFESKFVNRFTVTSFGSYYRIEVDLVYAKKSRTHDVVTMERVNRWEEFDSLEFPMSESRVIELRDKLLDMEGAEDIACPECVKPYYQNKKTGEYFCPACDA